MLDNPFAFLQAWMLGAGAALLAVITVLVAIRDKDDSL